MATKNTNSPGPGAEFMTGLFGGYPTIKSATDVLNNPAGYAGGLVGNIPNIIPDTWNTAKQVGGLIGQASGLPLIEQYAAQGMGLLPKNYNPALEQAKSTVSGVQKFAQGVIADPLGFIANTAYHDPIGTYLMGKQFLSGMKSAVSPATPPTSPLPGPTETGLPSLEQGPTPLTPAQQLAASERQGMANINKSLQPTTVSEGTGPGFVIPPHTQGKIPLQSRWMEKIQPPINTSEYANPAGVATTAYQPGLEPGAASRVPPPPVTPITPESLIAKGQETTPIKPLSMGANTLKNFFNVSGKEQESVGVNPNTWENLAHGNNMLGLSKEDMATKAQQGIDVVSSGVKGAANNLRDVNIADTRTSMDEIMNTQGAMSPEALARAKGIIGKIIQPGGSDVTGNISNGTDLLVAQKALQNAAADAEKIGKPTDALTFESLAGTIEDKIWTETQNSPQAQQVLATLKSPELTGYLRNNLGLNQVATDLENAQTLQDARTSIADVTRLKRIYNMDRIAGTSNKGIGTIPLRIASIGLGGLLGSTLGLGIPGTVAGSMIAPFLEPVLETALTSKTPVIAGKFVKGLENLSEAGQTARSIRQAIVPSAAVAGSANRAVNLPATPPSPAPQQGGLPNISIPGLTTPETTAPPLKNGVNTSTDPNKIAPSNNGTYSDTLVDPTNTLGPTGNPLAMSRQDYLDQKAKLTQAANNAIGDYYKSAQIKNEIDLNEQKWKMSEPLNADFNEKKRLLNLIDFAMAKTGTGILDQLAIIPGAKENLAKLPGDTGRYYQALQTIEGQDATGLSKGSLTSNMFPDALKSRLKMAAAQVIAGYNANLNLNVGNQPTAPIVPPGEPQYPITTPTSQPVKTIPIGPAPFEPPRGAMYGVSAAPGGGGAGLPPLPRQPNLPPLVIPKKYQYR